MQGFHKISIFLSLLPLIFGQIPDDFAKAAESHFQKKALASLNLAWQQAKLEQGLDPRAYKPSELEELLKTNGYLPEKSQASLAGLTWTSSFDALILPDARISSPKTTWTTDFLIQLVQTDDLATAYALELLQNSSIKDPRPLFKASLKLPLELRHLSVKILKQFPPSAYSNLALKDPPALNWPEPEDPSLSASNLFFKLILDLPLPDLPMPVFLSLFDEKYTVALIAKAFQKSKISKIEELSTALTEGYGDKFAEVAEVLAHFPNNKICLKALAFALKNRDLGHFAQIEPKILHIWENMTGIPWSGSDAKWFEWYEKKKNQ